MSCTRAQKVSSRLRVQNGCEERGSGAGSAPVYMPPPPDEIVVIRGTEKTVQVVNATPVGGLREIPMSRRPSLWTISIALLLASWSVVGLYGAPASRILQSRLARVS